MWSHKYIVLITVLRLLHIFIHSVIFQIKHANTPRKYFINSFMLIFYQVLYGGWIQINENQQNAETSWCILIDSITSWYASYYKTFLNFQQHHTCRFETATFLSLPGYHHSWFSFVCPEQVPLPLKIPQYFPKHGL